MGKHYLSPLFTPKSIAVFGASSAIDSVGGIVYRNIRDAGFRGNIYAVNPKHRDIDGNPVHASLDTINERLDLAVVATPAEAVPDIIESCGKHGVRAAVVLSAGFSEIGTNKGKALERAAVEQAKRYGVRLIGPNCLGVMRPSAGLNVTFNKGMAKAGNLALVSQSGAICTSILDWAHSHDIGFSSVVSTGIAADLDFGEILDYLVADPETESILMYIEGIHHARSFMSALRAASRIKPVIAVKVGRHEAASRAAKSHTGALVGADDTFDAALRRAGVLRVMSIGQLFSAAKALACRHRPRGNRLAIVTNGGGPGIMATDRAIDLGIQLARLTEPTMAALNELLPAAWSHSNPVDVVGDATPERYKTAVQACLNDPEVDGVLVILTPQAMTQPREVAQVLIDMAGDHAKPILTSWMGEMQVQESRNALQEAGIPNFRTPEGAVEAFAYMALHAQNQKILLQTPASLSAHLADPDIEGARMLIECALTERRQVLSEMESKALLAAFHIPVAKTMVAHSPNEALLLAEQLGFPIAMKINSPDITHKSDVGGVRLNLTNAQAVRTAYNEIIAEVRRHRPDARLDGVSIENMVVKPNGREVMVGVTGDPVFGPVITFGGGGVTVEVYGDRSVALPPLNRNLADNLIRSSHVSRLLGAFRQMPPVNLEAVESVLLRVSEMVCELPWLKEMDINPLIVDEHGALAADARIVVDYQPPAPDRYAHMAIYPYPTYLVSHWQLPDGTDITIRPIRPEDAEIERNFVRNLSDQSRYYRFQAALSELTPAMLVRFTQIDYDREMALIAVTEDNGKQFQIGVARYVINPDAVTCEFALVVADEWQSRGLGSKLMSCLMDAARIKGLLAMEGTVLSENYNMLQLVSTLGFRISQSEEDVGLKRVARQL